jgi:hypothetical protein
VLKIKQINMRYIFNRVCATYSIVFINSNVKITQHKNLKEQPCFKNACRTHEKQLHSFQQVLYEKSLI